MLLISVKGFSQKPIAGFYANVTEGCAPLQVSFFDTSTNVPTGWKWDFGDGGANAFIQNPKRTYDLPGTYSIQLIASNSVGGDTVVYTSYIKVYGKPSAGFTATPPSGCAPLTVQFADSSTSGSGIILKWEWFLGDGEVDSIQNPQHSYTGNKTYQVTLIVTDEYGCKDSEVKQIATYKPTAKFTASKTSICKDTLTVSFTNNSTGDAPLSYFWDFGDGETSTEKSPNHFYSGYGDYIVTLNVTNANSCTDNTSTTISLIDFQPDFEANDTVICAGETITFTDSTANSGTKTWFWGDTKKNTTSAKTITKSYTDAGTYTVQMTVNSIGNSCTQTVTKTNYITVLPLPEPKISIDDSIPCQFASILNFSAGLSVSDTIMWVIWNEPDTDKVNNVILSKLVNDSLYGNNPAYQVSEEDSFHVMLYVTGQNGCKTSISQNDFVILKEPDPYISAVPIRGCVPLEVFFSDNNSIAYFGDSIVNYEWEFNDTFATGSTTATGKDVSYTWDSAGTYYAKLTIKTARGCSAVSYQFVFPGKKPVAGMKLPAFTVDGDGINDTSLCFGSSIWFRDSSQGLANDWSWVIKYLDDSDGNKTGGTGGKEIEYIFDDTLGYFDLLHIVSYNECYDTVIYTAITDTSIDMSTMPDSVIRIEIKGPIPGFRGDSLIYHADTLNSFQDTLFIGTDTINITSDMEIIGPDTTFIPAAFDTFITNNDTILIPSAWDTVIGKPDTFLVIAETIYNLADSVIFNTDTLYFPADTLYISALQSEIISCPDTITIKFQTEDVLADSIVWHFEYPDEFVSGHPDSVIKGNPKTFGTYSEPFHIYEGPGFFSVRQHVFNGKTNCDDIKLSKDLIKISALKSIFSIDTNIACKSLPLTLKDSSITNSDLNILEENYINRIEWDFADGTTLVHDRNTLNYPAYALINEKTKQDYFDFIRKSPFTHYFQKTGKLKITNFVYDDLGCADSSSEYVVIKGTDINFVADTLIGCEPFTVNFADSSTGTDSVYSWVWDFGDNTTSLNPFPKHIYKNSGEYSVSLKTINLDLCSDTLVKPTYIKCLKPKPTFTIADNVKCNQETFSFDAKNTTGERLKYIWVFGDSSYTITTSNSAAHPYQIPESISDSSYTVKLIAIDSIYRCFDSYEKTLIVESPIAGFAVDETEGCLPMAVQFFDTSQTRSSAVYWAWEVGDSITFEGTGAGQQYPTNVYSSPGIYDVSLTIVNSEGCSSKVKIDSFIVVKGANINYNIGPAIGCSPLKVTFNYTSDNPNAIDIIDYGDGVVDTVTTNNSYSHTYKSPQTFKPILTVTDGFCVIPFNLNVISSDSLISSFQTDSLVHCNLEEYVFKDLSENKHPGSYISTWQWDFGDSTTSNDSIAIHTYSKEGTYLVTRTVTTFYGCASTDSVLVYVFKTPTIDIYFSDEADCVPLTINFGDSSTTGSTITSWYWDFGDGSFDTSKNVSHTYDSSGIYKANLYITLDDTCVYLDENKGATISAYNIPEAGFTQDTTVTGTLHPLIQFYDSSFTDPNVLHTWLWNFGDPASGNDNTSDEFDPSHKYSTPGYYEVMLIVSNYGCADTFFLTIPAYNNEKFNPPNIVTPPPNTPGVNDVFFIPGLPENSKLIIYNRWGQEIFKSADSGYLNNWDGGNMPPDTYYYILTNAQTGLKHNGFLRISR